MVLTNALIVDHSGVYKADIGLKGQVIAGIGKAGAFWFVYGVWVNGPDGAWWRSRMK